VPSWAAPHNRTVAAVFPVAPISTFTNACIAEIPRDRCLVIILRPILHTRGCPAHINDGGVFLVVRGGGISAIARRRTSTVECDDVYQVLATVVVTTVVLGLTDVPHHVILFLFLSL
jgi:hypothetical protein